MKLNPYFSPFVFVISLFCCSVLFRTFILRHYPEVEIARPHLCLVIYLQFIKVSFSVSVQKNQKILEPFITQIISSSCREVNFTFLKPAPRRRRQPIKSGLPASLLKTFVFSSKRQPPPTLANPHSTVEVYRLELWLNHAVFRAKCGKFASARFLLGQGG